MRVIQVHNRYRVRGGEETAVDATVALLRSRGVHVEEFLADSRDIAPGLRGRIQALAGGIYSRASYRAMARVLRSVRPDIVHVHNLYPLISPSVLSACRGEGVPVVMSCHNYRLVCPVGILFSRGEVCERCWGGREYWCALRNCAGSITKSTAYALRGYAARGLRLFSTGVILFIAPSEFVRRKFAQYGFGGGPAARAVVVVPHLVPAAAEPGNCASGRYAAFAGRVTPEKGIGVLLEAAALCPEMPVRIAGDCSAMVRLAAAAPPNVQLLGHLDQAELRGFYAGARFLVVPSLWFETFGLAAAEAMGCGLPVIASRVGALPEAVEDGVTGLLCEPGNAAELAQKMRLLWGRPELCREMGRAGRERMMRRYNPGVVYELLRGAYARALQINERRMPASDRRP